MGIHSIKDTIWNYQVFLDKIKPVECTLPENSLSTARDGCEHGIYSSIYHGNMDS